MLEQDDHVNYEKFHLINNAKQFGNEAPNPFGNGAINAINYVDN